MAVSPLVTPLPVPFCSVTSLLTLVLHMEKLLIPSVPIKTPSTHTHSFHYSPPICQVKPLIASPSSISVCLNVAPVLETDYSTTMEVIGLT